MTEKFLFHPDINDIITAPPSKSEVLRLLLCAALSDKPVHFLCSSINGDISAAVSCLNALGAEIKYKNGEFFCRPIKDIKENAVLYCGESAAALRFLLPAVCFFGKRAVFVPEGRLYRRPVQPLVQALEKSGASVIQKNGRIFVSGKAESKNYSISGDISSQFISGLMFMLSLSGGCIQAEHIQSRPYIELTAAVLRSFGCRICFNGGRISVSRRVPLIPPENIYAGGDWSGAAFFITAGCIGKKAVKIYGLDKNSVQGDKRITDILKSFGAEIYTDENSVTACPSALIGIEADAGDIPDLVPVLAIAAAAAEGTTKLYNISRLRFKESDRVKAVCDMIKALGGCAYEENGCLTVIGTGIKGGRVNSFNDHRIAMSAAAAAAAADGPVIIENPECVRKSYPGFWNEFN